MSNKVNFYYVRDEQRKPIACIAYKREGDDKVVFGLSTHNPVDDFNREIARHIAQARLENERTARVLLLVGKTPVTRVLEWARGAEAVPKRTARAIERLFELGAA